MLQDVSQVALDLNYDGLMIESHISPEHALSDSKQQITPSALGELLESLVIRQSSTDDIIFLNLLEELRDKIDQVDAELLIKISDRMKIAREIGKYKKENSMTILAVERWNEILSTRLKFGLNKDLSSDFIVKLYALIHDESIRQQTIVMNLAGSEKEKIKSE